MTTTVLSIALVHAGRRISPMLITPFTEFTEGHVPAVLTAHTIVLVVCYALLVFMQLTRDLFAIAKFLFSFWHHANVKVKVKEVHLYSALSRETHV